MDRGDIWYKSFLDLTEDHAQLKSDLRKLAEWIRDQASDAYTNHEHRRYAAYRDCLDKIEKLLDGGNDGTTDNLRDNT